MKKSRQLMRAIVIAAAMSLTSGAAFAQDCQPGLNNAVQGHLQSFVQLVNTLPPQLGNLAQGLAQVADQPTYAALLATSRTIVGGLANSRLLIALPDGTVVLDTARTDDPNNTLAVGNSFAHFQAKTVNENHNSRVAIMAAQMFPCGVGIESKLSTTTGRVESYLAIRMGNHLDSIGTARLSITPQ